MSKRRGEESRVPEDEFVVWVTMKLAHRPALKQAASKEDIPLSEFCRQAIRKAAEKSLGVKLEEAAGA